MWVICTLHGYTPCAKRAVGPRCEVSLAHAQLLAAKGWLTISVTTEPILGATITWAHATPAGREAFERMKRNSTEGLAP